MNTHQNLENELPANEGTRALNIISWLFGTLFFAIGVVNTFWGNDPAFGVFIVLLSLVYFLPVNDILDNIIGLRITRMWLVKILLGMFIIWAAMGVGELFDKIELMLLDLK
ncbi:hypothetical protein [Pontibacter arcticus]|uniref:Uncharacterized protein n=1 Tax=Pontibacter arcticus TaxID=2080288 RepID=A0A364RC58_9BACT|nr:hypothetical protein [Pontibacter arcticus]RAU81845.1 hypothetical protein DP923_14225 [Pontibacter arcticus]